MPPPLIAQHARPYAWPTASASVDSLGLVGADTAPPRRANPTVGHASCATGAAAKSFERVRDRGKDKERDRASARAPHGDQEPNGRSVGDSAYERRVGHRDGGGCA